MALPSRVFKLEEIVMPKYLCMQRSLPTAPAAPKPSPTQMQDMYAKFAAWRAQFEANLVDLGGKLGAGRLVTDESADGPIVEVKELVGGYMIVEAESLEGAIEVARACPGLVRSGSGVEVIEIHAP